MPSEDYIFRRRRVDRFLRSLVLYLLYLSSTSDHSDARTNAVYTALSPPSLRPKGKTKTISRQTTAIHNH